MLHAKIIYSSKAKIQIKKAESFLSSSKFGAIIYFIGTNLNQMLKIRFQFDGEIQLTLFN